MRIPSLIVFSLLLAIGGCGSKVVLLTKPAAVPDGVDLSGQWLLRETSGTTQPAARESLVHVFLETGRSVKVTQVAAGLFVSFDRSVVEEYRFGENRRVSVGEISAERVSGWESGSYVIETLDDDGAILIDAYRLDKGGQELRRSIRIRLRDTDQMSLEQVFDRV